MMGRTQLFRTITIGLILAGTLFLVVGVLAFPTPTSPWLSKNNGSAGAGSDGDAQAYYNTIGAPLTFADWKTAYGFDGGDEVHAIYYNGGDLGFGRNMHCRRNGADIACYVANHGFGPASPPALAVEAAINGTNAGPIVAMVYHSAVDSNPNDVTFYIYESPSIDPNQSLINKVPLDGDGEKYLPHVCLACHGGQVSASSGVVEVSDANFLPFDIASFSYSLQPAWTLTAQEEELRQLNAMVRDTNPTTHITGLINGWYGSQVDTVGASFDDGYVPDAYNANVSDTALYEAVVKPYCRSCHIAQGGFWTLEEPSQVNSALTDVFSFHIMPHAELTNHNFWAGDVPAILADNRDWSIKVTNANDAGAGSLRQAIIEANAATSPAIITFAKGMGTITLTSGELLLSNPTAPIIILGRGASHSIIDGNNASRVFNIDTDTVVIIKGVTIQGGETGGFGAGIANRGSLSLLASSVKNNSSSLGSGGVDNNGDTATATIAGSTIGPNNFAPIAGGVWNYGGQLTIDNSTISGNIADGGGGLVNSFNGVISVTHTTIVNNSAVIEGGGVYNDSDATLNIRGSIIAGNSSPVDADCANLGTYKSLEYNLIGSNGSANGCPVTGMDIVPSGSIDTVLNTSLEDNGSGIIDDLNVLNLSGSHTWVGDLDFNLTSPAGTTVQIMARSCDSADNFYLNLDDEAGGTWPCPPAGGGSYQPSNPLSVFDGEDPNGIWILTINDNADLDGGRLHGWSLELCSAGRCRIYDSIDTFQTIPSSGTPTITSVLNVADSGVPYHALRSGSPAIDAIPLTSNTCLLPSYDQRNIARPLAGSISGPAACDIGAFEALDVVILRNYLPLIME